MHLFAMYSRMSMHMHATPCVHIQGLLMEVLVSTYCV